MSKPWKDIPRKGKEVKLDDESEIGERREFLLKLAKDLGVSKQIALETLFEEIAYETQASNIEFENLDAIRADRMATQLQAVAAVHAESVLFNEKRDHDAFKRGLVMEQAETSAGKGWFWKWNPFS